MMTVLKQYCDRKMHVCRNDYNPTTQMSELYYYCDDKPTNMSKHIMVRKQHVTNIPVFVENSERFRANYIYKNNSIFTYCQLDDNYNNEIILDDQSFYMQGKRKVADKYSNLEFISSYPYKHDFNYMSNFFENLDINTAGIAVNNDFLDKKDFDAYHDEIAFTINRNIKIEFNNVKINYLDYAPYKTIDADASISFEYYECDKCGQLFLFKPSCSYVEDNISIKMYDDIDKIKIACFVKRVKTVGKNAFKSYCKNILVFKKDDLKSYCIENVGVKGISYFQKNYPTKIYNITYKQENFDDQYFCGNRIFKLFYDKVDEYLKSINPVLFNYIVSDKSYIENAIFKNEKNKISIDPFTMQRKQISSNKAEINSIYPLFYIRKNFGINSTLLAEFILVAKKYQPKNMMTKLKGKTEAEIMKYFGLNNKLLNRLVTQECTYVYLSIKTITDNLGYINKVLDSDCHMCMSATKKEIRTFMKKTGIKEKWMVNSVLKDQDSFIQDTIDIYNQIIELNPEYEIKVQKDIKETHDNLLKDYKIVKNENKPIKPNDELNKLFSGVHYSDIKYVMPEDTNELVNVGNLMNVCVGSYGAKAVAQNCYIVVGYDKDGQPKTCIELQKHKQWELVQVKKTYNNYPSEGEAEAIAKLCKHNNIQIKECFDIKQYKKDSYAV